MVVEIELFSKSGINQQEEVEIRTLLDSFKWAEIDKYVRETAIQIRRNLVRGSTKGARSW